MTEREDHKTEVKDEVVTEQGRLVGCRGRVLIALVVLAVLFVILSVLLVRGLLNRAAPLPASQASAVSTPQTWS